MAVEEMVDEGAERGSGMRVVAMTMTDEFGGMVTRYEPDKVHNVGEDGRASTQKQSDFTPTLKEHLHDRSAGRHQ
jgi:hypothetical protein